jgi:hypothetical protein
MTPEEEHFKNLLARLENPKPALHDSLPEVIDTTFPDSPTTRELEIVIMKSKIFHQGRLKGGKKANVGRRQEYNSYQIIDLENLVNEAAFSLFYYLVVVRDIEKPTALITGLFERLLQYYDLMAKTVLDIGAVKENTISDTKGVIEGWKRKTLNIIKKASIRSLCSKSYYENDLKAKLAILLINNVPEASPSRIANCISVLLSHPLFNIIVNIGTFRKEVMELKRIVISQK